MTRTLINKMRDNIIIIQGKERQLGLEENNRVMNVFFEAYQIHKKQYGSIQHLNGKEYDNKMCKRYDYMKEKAIEYLESISKTEKANLGGKE